MSIAQLSGKIAVITGGTRGIGEAIARLFVEQGASVAILGMNEERGQEVVASLQGLKKEESQKISFYRVDVSNHAEVEAFGKLFGGCDILVNCAGITRDKLFISMNEEDWDRVLDTNLKSVYNMTHAFLRGMMKKHTGRIVNITSVVGFMGNPGQANYAASKAGMIGFTRSLAKEVASRNVLINCIAPGFIDTDMTESLTEVQKKQILDQVPMGRLGKKEEIAQMALFLVGEGGNYITGQVLTVDGGMTA